MGCTPMGVIISVTSPAASSITSYAWQITTPSGSVLTASTSQYVAIFSQPGSYGVSLTINGNQTTSIADYVSVYAKPTASFTVNDPAGCFPLCVDFTDTSLPGSGNINQWSWDFGNGNSSSIQLPSHCYNQVGTFTPVLTVTNSFGCFATVSAPGLMHVVNNFPTAQFQLSSQLDCNAPVNINMTNSSTGTSSLTSTWDFGDGDNAIVSGTTATSHTYNTTGTYDVCLNVMDSIGCEGSVCHPLTIFGTANATYNVSATQGCTGTPITFTSTTTPTPTSVQWDFNGDGITDSNNLTASYTYNTPGIFQPKLTVSYSSGCSDVSENAYSISIVNGTTVAFTADTLQACSFPFTVQFTNESVGIGPINYAWSVGGVQVSTSTNFTHTFNGYGSFNIKLVATNSTGCVNQLLMNSYILVQAPTVTFGNPISVCTEQNVNVGNVVVTAVEPVQEYNWDFNSDGIIDAQGLQPIYSYTEPGIYHITLTIVTVSGCTATFMNTMPINVLTNVDATFTASTDTTCAGQPVEFCVGNQPGNTFSWNFFDGSGWVIMPLNTDCLTHDYPDTGWFNVSLTVFNGACNIMQTFENFIYVEPPVAVFEYSVVCGQLQAEFVDISIGADSIVWDFGDGSPLLSNDPNPTHTFALGGTYTVVLSAYAAGSNCPDYLSVEISVSDANANMTFAPTTGCPPLNVSLGSEVYNPHWDVLIGNGDHITADWVENGSYWTINHTHNSLTLTYEFTSPDYFEWPSVVFEQGGYFDIMVSTTDANGCSASQFYDDVIHVSANPDFATFTTTPVDVCNSVNFAFQPTLSGLETWSWVFSDGAASSNENPTHTFSPPYNYSQPLSATLTATDALGCSSTVTQTITAVLPPLVSFSAGSNPACAGNVVQFINASTGPAGTTYAWNFGDPSSSGNTSVLNAPAHTYNANGVYEVCLTANNNAGCTRTLCNPNAISVVNPVVSFTHSDVIVNCLYGVQFVNTTPGTVVTSLWNFGDDQIGFGMTPNHTYPIGVYDVKLKVTNNFGCTDSLTVPDIFNYGNQIGPFSQLLDTAACAPFDASFSAFNINDTYFSYFWDFNDGSGDPTGNTITTHTYLTHGTYCPSVIMTDPNGCPVLIGCEQPIVVEEFELGYSVPSYICFGDTLHMSITNGSSFLWQDPSLLSQGNNNNEFLLHPFDDATYIVTGYYADCIRTDTILLEVKDLPAVSFDMNSTVCFNDALIELTQGFPNDPPGVYTLDGNVIDTFNPSMPGSVNYQVIYRYTDLFQCTDTASDWIYVHPLPFAIFNDFNDVCENVGNISIDSALPPGGVYTFGADTITSFDSSVGFGHYEFQYTFTDNFGCVDVDSAVLNIRPMPDTQFEFAEECLDIGLHIQNLSTMPEGIISQSLWNFGTGGQSLQYAPQPVFFPTSGTHAISLISTSEYGCVTTRDSSVYIHPVPHVMFSPNIACQNTPQTFVDESSIESDQLVAWLWTIENQTMLSQDSIEYTFNNWGPTPVTLTAISSFGCDESKTISVMVRPAPVVSLNMENNCFGVESIFTSNTTIPIGGVVSEVWEFGDGHPDESGSTADNFYENTGVYNIHYTATSNVGCVSEWGDSIRVYSLPVVDFVIDSSHVCEDSPFSLLDLSSVDAPSNIVEWEWRFDNNVVSTEQNPELEWPWAASFNVTLQATSDHGCTADSTTNSGIIIYPKPTAGFTAQEHAWASNPLIEVGNTSSDDVTTWQYNFGDDEIESFEEGSHFYEENGSYYITQTVWNLFGCRDATSRLIVIRPEELIHIPTAFTPDDNGHNETFLPILYGFELTYYHLKIFDRWGIQVFSTKDLHHGWNGIVNSEIGQDGAYPWSLEYRTEPDGPIKNKTGVVILLK